MNEMSWRCAAALAWPWCRATEVARERELSYELHLADSYRRSDFRHTEAVLMNLRFRPEGERSAEPV